LSLRRPYIRVISLFCTLLLATFVLAEQSATSSPKTAHKTTSKTHHSSSAKSSSHKASGKSSTKGKHSKKSASYKHHGQQKIDSARAEQIQSALIREHYLTGEPTGKWDASSEQAMQKFQADNGWQSKTTPDSRALIKLGLGPDHDHLLNPESAMTGPVKPVSASPAVEADPEKAQP
jgi:hypothetical protein